MKQLQFVYDAAQEETTVGYSQGAWSPIAAGSARSDAQRL